MDIEERRVEVGALSLGMFVCRLDRPWTETPFALQGFSVDSNVELEQLRRLCQYVYIDVVKSEQGSRRSLLQRLGFHQLTKNGRALSEPSSYPVLTQTEDELPAARRALADAQALAGRVIDDVRAGRRLDAADLQNSVEPIVASVIRNADAFFWLEALRKRDAYAYSHAVNCCALATAFGRHLGFPRESLLDLASAGMLLDIGKAALPEAVFQHAGSLDDESRRLVQSHVELGLDLLQQSGHTAAEVIEAIRHHHERHDGSGYPAGLSGSAIPLTGRMLGLVDSYDAICSDRPHQAGKPRHDALQMLYKQRDQLFQADLIEQFSQCLGVYPTGSLVELSSGEIALVMAQNPARRLYPRVTVLTHPDKAINAAFPCVDLWPHANAAHPSQRIFIARALPRSAVALDLSEIFL